MGIERFFSSINKKFNIIQDINFPYSKIKTSHLFIDFNSIIHVISSKISYNSKQDISIEKLIIDEVKNYVINLLTNNFDKNYLKFIMIAIDGVPSKAKMVEQRKRRYMGELIKILLDNDNNTKWNKNNISPGTYFMDLLSREMNSKDFLIQIKNNCPQLNKVLVSDIYYFEEGEKKITNCINNMKFSKDDIITIYSPDSDVILLALILKISTSRIFIYRHDQQKSDKNYVFNLINIEKLKTSIDKYIDLNKEIPKSKKINDIVLIFTIFGDDFLPKIKSYDVKNDINKILDFYNLTLFYRKKGNLIENNKMRVDFFTELLGFMSRYEKNVIEYNRLDDKYHNFNRVSNHLFYQSIKNFERSMNFKFLKNTFLPHKYLLIEYLDKKLVYQTIKKNHVYNYLYFYFVDIDEIVSDIILYCQIKNTNTIPLLNFNKKFKTKINTKLIKYSISSKDTFHANNLNKLNKNERKEYILTNKLDQYYYKFNVNKNINKLGKNTVEEYLRGVNWIFEYYFNDNLSNKFWCYPYINTPSIYELYNYLIKKPKLVFRYHILDDLRYHFTVLEQLLFIFPLKNIDIKKSELFKNIPKKYLDLIQKFINKSSYFIDLDEISKLIIDNKENKEIDCFEIFYLNKCNLKQLDNNLDLKNEFINDFRKYIKYEEQIKIFPMKVTELCKKVILGKRTIK